MRAKISFIIIALVAIFTFLLIRAGDAKNDCNCPGKKTNFSVTNMSVNDTASQEKMEKAPEMRRRNYDEIKYDEANRMKNVHYIKKNLKKLNLQIKER